MKREWDADGPADDNGQGANGRERSAAPAAHPAGAGPRAGTSTTQETARDTEPVGADFRAVLESAPDAIVISDRSGKIVLVNRQAERMFGYRREEMLGCQVDLLVPERLRDRHEQQRAAYLRHPTIRTVRIGYDLYGRRKDGSEFPVAISLSPLATPEGTMVTSIIRDVTERRRMAIAMREREEILRLFIEHTPLAIAMLDRDLRYIFASRRWVTDRALEGQALAGRSYYETVPDAPRRWREVLARCLEGAHESGEDELPGRDGRPEWVRWEVLPWRHGNGETGGVIIFSEVITERKLAEEALRQSEERYRRLVELSPEMIAVHSGGKIVYINPAGARMLGAERPEQIIGRPVLDLVSPEYVAAVRQRVVRMEEGRGTEPPLIERFVRLDGTPLDVEVAAGYITYQGQPAVQVLARDITERRRADEALRQAHRELEEAYQREHRIAVRFQEALLPRAPLVVPGYEIAQSYRPALMEADVGGDFLNLFPIDEQRIGLVMGDVGGKGLDAAVLAARVQHSVAALAMHERHSPATVVEGVRRVVAAFEELDQLVTLFFAILEPQSGRLRYANAGHEPPLIWREGEGRVRAVPADGLAICWLPGPAQPTREILLAPGDVLLLYTDGLPDAWRGRTTTGWDAIWALLARHHSKPVGALLQALFDAAVAQSQGRLYDDIALLALRRDGG